MDQYQIAVDLSDGTTLTLGPYYLMKGEFIPDIAQEIYEGNYLNDRMLWLDGGDEGQTLIPTPLVRLIRIIAFVEEAALTPAEQAEVVDIGKYRHPAGGDTA